jgi:hypothetical protein
LRAILWTLGGSSSKRVQNSGSADDFTERAWPCPRDSRLWLS